MRRSLLLLIVALVALAAIVAVGSWWLLDRAQVPTGVRARADDAPPAITIGGPFELTAHTGTPVTDADFRGNWLLVFFGYTFCPDVCPTALGTVALVMDELGDLAERVQPLFVTVDPERDTPEVLAEYVTQFHPRIIGLTGTPEQIASIAGAYRAFYRKVVPEGSAEIDYLMDHSAYLYVMGPNGEFLRVFSHSQSPEEIAAAIRALMTAGS